MKKVFVFLFVLCSASLSFGQQYLSSITLPIGAGGDMVVPGFVEVAAARNRVYVTTVTCPFNSCPSPISNDLIVIDGASDTIVNSIHFGFQIFDSVYNPVNDRLYLATFQGGIQVIDPGTNTVVGVISSVPESSYLAVNTTTNTLYASDFRA